MGKIKKTQKNQRKKETPSMAIETIKTDVSVTNTKTRYSKIRFFGNPPKRENRPGPKLKCV